MHAINTRGSQIDPPEVLTPGSHVLWVRCRPGMRRGAALASDTLTALGKNLALRGHGRNEHEDINLAVAWMRAADVTDLVLWDVQELSWRVLPTAEKLADLVPARLWLLVQPPITDPLARRLQPHLVDSSALAQLTAHPNPTTAHMREPKPWDLGPAPDTPFTHFRHQLPDLSPLLTTTYDRQWAHTQLVLTHGVIDEALRDVLADLLHDALDDARLLTALKAVQAAAWTHDRFVSIDYARLMTTPERPTVTSLEAETLLLAYRQPHRMLATALTLRGIDLNTIRRLRVADVNPEGHIHGDALNGDSTPPLQSAFKAQSHLMQLLGHDQGSPLLPLTDRTLTQAIRDAATDLGIHAHGRRILSSNTRDQWLRSLGITIRDLP